MKEASSICSELLTLVNKWEPILTKLPDDVISNRRNIQNRTIKQIVGHMIDSVSNNTHRIIHLQNQPGPLVFPNYATLGNNDRWIAIQDFQNEDWQTLVQLWKYSILHICHVMGNIDDSKLKNEWIAGPDQKVRLEEMVIDFPHHINLHIDEVNELIRLTPAPLPGERG